MTRIAEGIRSEDKSVFAQVAGQMKVWILVRGTNKASLQFIGKPGYWPKPVECKAKTADQGGVKAGLVVSPIVDKHAFSERRAKKAKDAWDEFMTMKGVMRDASSGLPMGYTIEMTDPAYKGCIRKDGHLLHGDYDLYDVVDPEDPGGETRVEKLVNGVAVSYSARSLAAQQALNAKFPSRMIQHGDHLSWKDHTGELIIAFGPGGEQLYVYPFTETEPLNEVAIRSVYKTIFPGRGSRSDQPFLMRQVQ